MAIPEQTNDPQLDAAQLKYRLFDNRNDVLIERLMTLEEVQRIINYFNGQASGEKMTFEQAFTEVKQRVERQLSSYHAEQRKVSSALENARAELYAAGGEPSRR